MKLKDLLKILDENQWVTVCFNGKVEEMCPNYIVSSYLKEYYVRSLKMAQAMSGKFYLNVELVMLPC